MTTTEKITRLTALFVENNIKDPTPLDYLMVEEAMLIGAIAQTEEHSDLERRVGQIEDLVYQAHKSAREKKMSETEQPREDLGKNLL